MHDGITRYCFNHGMLAEVLGWVPHNIGEVITIGGTSYKLDSVTSHMIDNNFVVREFHLSIY
jgi:hypothetical protein